MEPPSRAKRTPAWFIIFTIARATRPWAFIVDSDYQFAAIDFWRLEANRHRYDVILGKKSPRRDPVYRIVLSRGYNLLMRWFLHVPYRDMDTGFRLIRREIAQRHAGEVCFMSFFTAEFVIRAHYAGSRIVEVPVPHYARKIGSTTIFFISRLFLICFAQFIGILRLRAQLKKKGLFRRAVIPAPNNALAATSVGVSSGE